MKFLILVLIFAVVAGTVYSLPVDDFSERGILLEDMAVYENDNIGVRQRRVTCDLLSFGGKVGSSACAANCLSMGKAGGSCNRGICQCRKTTFKNLWNKRFG